DWTQRQWERLTGEGRDAASEQMAADIENIRTAWRYWVAEGNLEQVGRFTDSLWLLYDARGWYHATVSLTTDLLDLLSSTPSTPERVLEQITLQTSLARVLLTLKGYTQEVEDAYTRALELCEGRRGTRAAPGPARALHLLRLPGRVREGRSDRRTDPEPGR